MISPRGAIARPRKHCQEPCPTPRTPTPRSGRRREPNREWTVVVSTKEVRTLSAVRMTTTPSRRVDPWRSPWSRAARNTCRETHDCQLRTGYHQLDGRQDAIDRKADTLYVNSAAAAEGPGAPRRELNLPSVKVSSMAPVFGTLISSCSQNVHSLQGTHIRDVRRQTVDSRS